MVSSAQCLNKYGEPSNSNLWLIVWQVPDNLRVNPVVPKKIFINKDLVGPLSIGLSNAIERGFIGELKTWDGCFNIRQKRGLKSMSLHSWGVAFDINAKENGLGQIPKLSPEFVKCFTDAGLDWGGVWTRRDGMHFQISVINP